MTLLLFRLAAYEHPIYISGHLFFSLNHITLPQKDRKAVFHTVPMIINVLKENVEQALVFCCWCVCFCLPVCEFHRCSSFSLGPAECAPIVCVFVCVFRCIVEAWNLLRQHSNKLNMEELLMFLYETCLELGLMEEVLKLPLGLAEQVKIFIPQNG